MNHFYLKFNLKQSSFFFTWWYSISCICWKNLICGIQCFVINESLEEKKRNTTYSWTSSCDGQSYFSERNLLHFALTLASGRMADEGYAPLCFARSGAAVPANEEIYVVLYEYAAQVITVNVLSAPISSEELGHNVS